MAMTLARASTAVGVGAGYALLGPVAGPVEAFGALAIGTYFQTLAPGALPGVDEALTDAGAALLGRAIVPASVWIGLVSLSALGGLVLFEVLEVLEELGGQPF